MTHTLPALPYAMDALAPLISAQTLEFHYGKHHQTYVDNLNKFIIGTEFADTSLEEIVCTAPSGPIFNNAAQVRNHTFYWNCMGHAATNQKEPTGRLLEQITATFGSLTTFKEQFATSAVTNFGAGWTWLVITPEGKLEITNTSNAGCPLKDGKKPILTIDVREHAYYLDYQNRRAGYIEKRWDLVNWKKVEENV